MPPTRLVAAANCTCMRVAGSEETEDKLRRAHDEALIVDLVALRGNVILLKLCAAPRASGSGILHRTGDVCLSRLGCFESGLELILHFICIVKSRIVLLFSETYSYSPAQSCRAHGKVNFRLTLADVGTRERSFGGVRSILGSCCGMRWGKWLVLSRWSHENVSSQLFFDKVSSATRIEQIALYSGTVVGIADAAGQLLAQAVYVSSYMPFRTSILSSTHELVDKHLRRRTKFTRALGTIKHLSCLRATRMNQTEMSESVSLVVPLRGRQIATPVQQKVLLLSQYQAAQLKEYSLPSSSQEAQGELTADIPFKVWQLVIKALAAYRSHVFAWNPADLIWRFSLRVTPKAM